LSKKPEIAVSLQSVRRLAIAKQNIAEKPKGKVDSEKILQVVRDLGCLQLDPISVVAPSHQVVLWSRLGKYDLSELDKLLWKEKTLFEYWAHTASIVLTEDYPLYYTMMKEWPDTPPVGPIWRPRIKKWARKNVKVRDYVLHELKTKGPRLSRQFEKSSTKKGSWGWGSWNDVSRMLQHLFWRGEVMVVGRQGKQKVWGLTDEFLPGWAEKKELPDEEVEYRAAQRSLKSLGVATKSQVKFHFLRWRYPNLKSTLEKLEAESKVERVRPDGWGNPKETYYLHKDDISLLDRIESGRWSPRTTLLSPFDNLICDRQRTEELFGFNFRIGIYTPKAKRTHGYYVLPILYGDRLIGRVDPFMERKQRRFVVNAVHAEKEAPRDKQTAAALANAMKDLGAFIGAKEVSYCSNVPEFWKSSMR
jgi:uncharacterized protein